jgi:periplasmic divalent cation tolerance protein
MLIVTTTAANISEAEGLAEKIVRARLAACVQLVPIGSVYFWDGSVRKEREHLLLIKTLGERYDELERFIIANHSYSVPEIVAVKAERVSEDYLGWVRDYLD